MIDNRVADTALVGNFLLETLVVIIDLYNIIRTQRALSDWSETRKKIVLLFHARKIHIVKQLKKPKSCITP